MAERAPERARGGRQFSIQFENRDQLSIGYTDNYKNLVTDARISGAIEPHRRPLHESRSFV